MISLEDAVIARMKKGEKEFEIYVDPYKSRDLKQGEDVDIEDVVAANDVYEDAEKAKKASDSELNDVFGTTDFNEIAKKIINDGEIQLTTEQRREMREEKKKKVINWIHRNSINPQDRNPHPKDRIKRSIEKVGYHFDELKGVKEQAEEVLDKIRKEIPIKIEKLKIAVKIPPKHSGKASNALHSFNIKEEKWLNDGSYAAELEIPAGFKDDLYEKVNEVTHGENEIEVLED